MNNKTIGIVAIIALVLLALGYGIGRYATPPKIVEHEIIHEVQTKQDDIHTVTVVTEKPDGTKTTTVTQDDKSRIEDSKTELDTKVSSSATNWKATVGIGLDASNNFNRIYMLTVERRIVGNIYVGAFGTTGKELGLTIGATF